MPPITNRDLDVSEQKFSMSSVINGSVTGTTVALFSNGATVPLFQVPFPSTLKAMSVCAYGLSGSPTGELRIHRFIVGGGVTQITGVASSMALQTFGTSGALSASLVASGSTLLNLLQNDILCLHAGGGSSAAADKVMVGVVIQAVQDIIAHYGSST